jgi:hypothetical protein
MLASPRAEVEAVYRLNSRSTFRGANSGIVVTFVRLIAPSSPLPFMPQTTLRGPEPDFGAACPRAALPRWLAARPWSLITGNVYFRGNRGRLNIGRLRPITSCKLSGMRDFQPLSSLERDFTCKSNESGILRTVVSGISNLQVIGGGGWSNVLVTHLERLVSAI